MSHGTKDTFKVGEKVRLWTGEPLMTVLGYANDKAVLCQRIEDGVIDSYSVEWLQRAE